MIYILIIELLVKYNDTKWILTNAPYFYFLSNFLLNFNDICSKFIKLKRHVYKKKHNLPCKML